MSLLSDKNCGGVEFVVRETNRFMTRKDDRWHVVGRGMLLPSSDKGGEARRLATAALDAASEGPKPLLIGVLNFVWTSRGIDRRRFFRRIWRSGACGA